MSEQQPQQDPWTQPPTPGTPGAPGAQPGPVPPMAGQPLVPPAGGQPLVPPAAVPPAPMGWAPPRPYVGPVYQIPPQQVGVVAVDPRRRTRRILVAGGAAAVIAAALAVTVAVQAGEPTETSAVNSGAGQSSSAQPSGSSGGSSAGSSGQGLGGSAGSGSSGGSSSGGQGGFTPRGGDGDGDRYGFGVPGGQGGLAGGQGGLAGGGSQLNGGTAATTATAAQQKGVVTIDATLQYQGATSAGTGMILSSGGLVLTNNHVVDGATSIQVTDESTGKQYTATVVGTDVSADVALLQLKNASGLTPVTLDTNGGVVTGNGITAVGNAEGTGTLVAAAGTVGATDQTMTAQTETGAAAETLNGMIQFQADVVSGDSGGPLLDSQGEVVGMTTAASSGPGTTIAYAITIENALAVVHQIESGSTANGVTIGYPAFLGVAFSANPSGGLGGNAPGTTTSGATISAVINGTPAASAGLVAGDTITKVDGTSISTSDALSAALATHKPGDRVTITWVSGTTGASSSATVTLMAGPAN